MTMGFKSFANLLEANGAPINLSDIDTSDNDINIGDDIICAGFPFYTRKLNGNLRLMGVKYTSAFV